MQAMPLGAQDVRAARASDDLTDIVRGVREALEKKQVKSTATVSATAGLLADPLFTEDQTAEALDVQPTTLQVWRSTGRYDLPYVKIGRNVRYRKSAIEAFIEARTIETSATARAVNAKPTSTNTAKPVPKVKPQPAATKPRRARAASEPASA